MLSRIMYLGVMIVFIIIIILVVVIPVISAKIMPAFSEISIIRVIDRPIII